MARCTIDQFKERANKTMEKHSHFSQLLGYEIGDDYTIKIHMQIAPERRKTVEILRFFVLFYTKTIFRKKYLYSIFFIQNQEQKLKNILENVL